MSDAPTSWLAGFVRELKRRRVFRVAVVYAVVGYGVLEVADNFFPALQLPAWTVTFTAALVILGFPIALVLAWAFEVTPAGVKRTEPLAVAAVAPGAGAGAGSGRRSTRAAGYLGVGILLGLVGFGMLSYRAASNADSSAAATGDHGEDAADPVRSIAVLPFANMSTDAENEAFSDGLTEELLNVLAQVKGLRVPARTSSFAFKNVHQDITTIGRQLDVEVLLEGSVRKAGSRLKVTAQLISVADGSHMWSETYDRDLTDVFAIQEEIAEAIVQQLLPRFAGGSSSAPLVRPTTDDMDAYESYLQGRHQFWQQSGEPGLRTAAAFFEVAIEQDPDFALAHAGLADAYMLLGGSGFVPPHDIFPQSKAAAQRALELDTRLSEGYVALASINWQYDWDWAAADRNYRRSFSVNPLLHTRCICYAWYLAVTGDLDAAVMEAERAHAMDPLARLPRIIASWMYYLSGQHVAAGPHIDALFAMNANDGSARRIRAWMLWDAGRPLDAIAELEKVSGGADAAIEFAERGSAVMVADLASMYAQHDRVSEARTMAAKLEQRAARQYIPPEYVAAIHGALGQYDEAFRWLERAFENRSNLAQFNVLPLSVPLRAQPRYQALMTRVRLPQRE
jgi:TolB-like protein/tetratricopeptide (TPR) repeat protein